MLRHVKIFRQMVLFILVCSFFIPINITKSADESINQAPCLNYTYSWLFKHNYENDQLNARMNFEVQCRDSSGALVELRERYLPFTCSVPVGSVPIYNEIAYFDGSSYILCQAQNNQTLEDALEAIVERDIGITPFASYPGFWADAYASPTVANSGFTRNPILSFESDYPEMAFATSTQPMTPTVGFMEVLFEGQWIRSSDIYTSNYPSESYFYWLNSCPPNSICQMNYFFNDNWLGFSFPTDVVQFPTNQPLQFTIGYLKQEDAYFNGQIRGVRADPGCVASPGTGCTPKH